MCDDVEPPTPAGVAALRSTLEKMGWPQRTYYTEICDARDIEARQHPDYEKDCGYLWFLDRGIDVSCRCLLKKAMLSLGYRFVSADGFHYHFERLAS